MVLFLQILSLVCVAALLLSYSAYRRCLRPENRQRKSEAELLRQTRIYTAIMIASVAIIVVSTLILRKMVQTPKAHEAFTAIIKCHRDSLRI